MSNNIINVFVLSLLRRPLIAGDHLLICLNDQKYKCFESNENRSIVGRHLNNNLFIIKLLLLYYVIVLLRRFCCLKYSSVYFTVFFTVSSLFCFVIFLIHFPVLFFVYSKQFLHKSIYTYIHIIIIIRICDYKFINTFKPACIQTHCAYIFQIF